MKNKSIILSVIGFAATATGIFLIPFVLFNIEYRSEYFYYKVIWVEFLGIIFWSYIYYYFFLFSKDVKNKNYIRVFPAISVAIISYLSISFILIIISSALPDYSMINRIHFIIQLICFITLIVIIILFLQTSKLNITDEQNKNDKIKTPMQLITDLKNVLLLYEQNDIPKNNILIITLQSLIDKINYSLPHEWNILNNQLYSNYILEFDSLIDSIITSDYNVEINDEILNHHISQLNFLNNKIDLIVDSLKK